MSINVTLDYYSDLFPMYVYGDDLSNLPTSIIDAIDDYFDGFSGELGPWNPDNFYINMLTMISDDDVLERYNLDPGDESVTSYVDKHIDEITRCLQEEWFVLGREYGEWYVI